MFLDPPYGQGLVPASLAALQAAGWIGAATLVVAELGRDDPAPAAELLADFRHGAARMVVFRIAGPL